MAAPLAALRPDLDLMPSPVEGRPGLLIRDPMGYTRNVMIVPPPLVQLLRFFDGDSSELDLREALVRVTGSLEVGALVTSLTHALAESGFLLNDTYEEMKRAAEADFVAAPVREPTHLGPGGYPEDRAELRATLAQYMRSAETPLDGANVVGLASPHVSPAGGIRSYASAYAALGPEDAERTVVILGTSHYGRPDRFGLTRKPFRTPLGDTSVDTAVVDALASAAPTAVTLEDYCHHTEHAIEFQVVFLQHVLGPGLRIVPILVGAFARSLFERGLPEDEPAVGAFLGALAELHAREGRRLLWVLGVDMAHIGRRYGDSFDAEAGVGRMQEIARRDDERIARVLAGDAAGFWELVKRGRDDLRWCGAAPFYAFLRAVQPKLGRLLSYEQWNIDPKSVVSFAGLRFDAA